ncbi:uncharacterized protein LOC116299067 [Actinia tenebrosa]|uniref:Uncharacterized protein LOC116299067 n=1 Tax=Actinia tenebrosa TaxID=6105 RepID=A0A6P8ICN8_ACTTE|nr:uncharacterized protein LOC116299067 [Actinia tenebrosa]
MALCWGFVVALVALNLGLSEAQSNINSTVAIIVNPDSTTPADAGPVVPTTQMGATTAQTVETTAAVIVPATSTLSPCRFYTYLIVSFKSKSGCPVAKDALLKSKFGSFYANPMFDLKNIAFNVIREPACQFNFTFTFGSKLTMYDISEVFEDELKRIDNTVDTLRLTDIITYVNVAGVKLGDFKVAAGDCKKICCDVGPGSPITLYRDCEPSCKCRSYKLKKVEPNCMNICPQVCSGEPNSC